MLERLRALMGVLIDKSPVCGCGHALSRHTPWDEDTGRTRYDCSVCRCYVYPEMGLNTRGFRS